MAAQASVPLGRSASVHRARASVAVPSAGPSASSGGAEQPLANYLLGKEIGRGAFGVVFEALDRRTGSRVAVKRLPLYSVPPEDLPQILSEIDLLKRLEHPNIVRLIDSARTRDYLYICLELVEAGSLLQAIQRFGPLPEQLAAVYVAQVLRGLSFLAVQGVVHRDLKAANLLTTKDGIVKLSDFGVSVETTTHGSGSGTGTLGAGAAAAAVGAGGVAGSPYWLSPEVIELRGSTVKSDIWSLGATVVELVTGQPPFFSLPPMAAVFHIVQDDSIPLPSNFSPALRDFLSRCFVKDTALRASAKELLQHGWITSNLLAAAGAAAPPPASRGPGRRGSAVGDAAGRSFHRVGGDDGDDTDGDGEGEGADGFDADDGSDWDAEDADGPPLDLGTDGRGGAGVAAEHRSQSQPKPRAAVAGASPDFGVAGRSGSRARAGLHLRDRTSTAAVAGGDASGSAGARSALLARAVSAPKGARPASQFGWDGRSSDDGAAGVPADAADGSNGLSAAGRLPAGSSSRALLPRSISAGRPPPLAVASPPLLPVTRSSVGFAAGTTAGDGPAAATAAVSPGGIGSGGAAASAELSHRNYAAGRSRSRLKSAAVAASAAADAVDDAVDGSSGSGMGHEGTPSGSGSFDAVAAAGAGGSSGHSLSIGSASALTTPRNAPINRSPAAAAGASGATGTLTAASAATVGSAGSSVSAAAAARAALQAERRARLAARGGPGRAVSAGGPGSTGAAGTGTGTAASAISTSSGASLTDASPPLTAAAGPLRQVSPPRAPGGLGASALPSDADGWEAARRATIRKTLKLVAQDIPGLGIGAGSGMGADEAVAAFDRAMGDAGSGSGTSSQRASRRRLLPAGPAPSAQPRPTSPARLGGGRGIAMGAGPASAAAAGGGLAALAAEDEAAGDIGIGSATRPVRRAAAPAAAPQQPGGVAPLRPRQRAASPGAPVAGRATAGTGAAPAPALQSKPAAAGDALAALADDESADDVGAAVRRRAAAPEPGSTGTGPRHTTGARGSPSSFTPPPLSSSASPSPSLAATGTGRPRPQALQEGEGDGEGDGKLALGLSASDLKARLASRKGAGSSSRSLAGGAAGSASPAAGSVVVAGDDGVSAAAASEDGVSGGVRVVRARGRPVRRPGDSGSGSGSDGEPSFPDELDVALTSGGTGAGPSRASGSAEVRKLQAEVGGLVAALAAALPAISTGGALPLQSHAQSQSQANAFATSLGLGLGLAAGVLPATSPMPLIAAAGMVQAQVPRSGGERAEQAVRPHSYDEEPSSGSGSGGSSSASSAAHGHGHGHAAAGLTPLARAAVDTCRRLARLVGPSAPHCTALRLHFLRQHGALALLEVLTHAAAGATSAAAAADAGAGAGTGVAATASASYLIGSGVAAPLPLARAGSLAVATECMRLLNALATIETPPGAAGTPIGMAAGSDDAAAGASWLAVTSASSSVAPRIRVGGPTASAPVVEALCTSGVLPLVLTLCAPVHATPLRLEAAVFLASIASTAVGARTLAAAGGISALVGCLVPSAAPPSLREGDKGKSSVRGAATATDRPAPAHGFGHSRAQTLLPGPDFDASSGSGSSSSGAGGLASGTALAGADVLASTASHALPGRGHEAAWARLLLADHLGQLGGQGSLTGSLAIGEAGAAAVDARALALAWVRGEARLAAVGLDGLACLLATLHAPSAPQTRGTTRSSIASDSDGEESELTASSASSIVVSGGEYRRLLLRAGLLPLLVAAANSMFLYACSQATALLSSGHGGAGATGAAAVAGASAAAPPPLYGYSHVRSNTVLASRLRSLSSNAASTSASASASLSSVSTAPSASPNTRVAAASAGTGTAQRPVVALASSGTGVAGDGSGDFNDNDGNASTSTGGGAGDDDDDDDEAVTAAFKGIRGTSFGQATGSSSSNSGLMSIGRLTQPQLHRTGSSSRPALAGAFSNGAAGGAAAGGAGAGSGSPEDGFAGGPQAVAQAAGGPDAAASHVAQLLPAHLPQAVEDALLNLQRLGGVILYLAEGDGAVKAAVGGSREVVSCLLRTLRPAPYALLHHPSYAPIVLRALKAVRLLSSDPAAADALDEAGALSTLVPFLTREGAIAQLGSGAGSGGGSDAAAATAASEAGAIATSSKAGLGGREVSVHVLHALFNLTRVSPPRLAAAAAAGAVAPLMAVIAASPPHPLRTLALPLFVAMAHAGPRARAALWEAQAPLMLVSLLRGELHWAAQALTALSDWAAQEGAGGDGSGSGAVSGYASHAASRTGTLKGAAAASLSASIVGGSGASPGGAMRGGRPQRLAALLEGGDSQEALLQVLLHSGGQGGGRGPAAAAADSSGQYAEAVLPPLTSLLERLPRLAAALAARDDWVSALTSRLARCVESGGSAAAGLLLLPGHVTAMGRVSVSDGGSTGGAASATLQSAGQGPTANQNVVLTEDARIVKLLLTLLRVMIEAAGTPVTTSLAPAPKAAADVVAAAALAIADGKARTARQKSWLLTWDVQPLVLRVAAAAQASGRVMLLSATDGLLERIGSIMSDADAA